MRTLPFFTTALLVSSLSLASGRANAQIVTTFAGSGAAGSADGTSTEASFSNPQGVAVDAWGNVFVADTDNLEIRKVAPGGVVTTFVKLGGPDKYGGAATGVAVDASGNIYAADPFGDGIDGGVLTKTTPAGVVSWLPVFSAIQSPAGVAVDANGDLFVTDVYLGLFKVAADGTITVLTKIPLQRLWGVAVDSSGTVYAADPDHNRIWKAPAGGLIAVLAGSQSPGDADGVGAAASFFGPLGVAVDSIGNVYVADTGNNRIRKITPGGVVTTLAGTGTQGK